MTQKVAVMKYIRDYGSITPMEAFADLGITKLATIVSNLIHEDNIQIKKTPMGVKNRYGRMVYFMKYSFPEETAALWREKR